VSKETVSRITDKIVAEMNDWTARPLDAVYAAVFPDAIVVKVRDGQVADRPVYAAIGVTVDGRKDVLGLWTGTGGEGAKFWTSVLVDLKNRGVQDVFFLVCDGLKGLPEVVANVWPQTVVQTCVVHLIRNTFRLVVGAQVRGDDPVVAQRLGRVRALPRLRRRDPADDLLHQRRRVAQRPLPPGGPRPWTSPDRAGRDEVPVPCHPQPRPDRDGPRQVDDALEARAQCLRHHVR